MWKYSKNNYKKIIKEVLVTEEQIQEGIKLSAKWINDNYHDKTPIIVGILKGCIPFLGAIIPKLRISHTLDFINVNSFMGQTKALIEPQLVTDINFDVQDKDIILVEDIIDSGKTIKLVVDLLKKLGARDVKIITLIDKKEGRTIELEPDFYCFSIPLHFIIGFGLDYKGYFRNLPFIGILSDEFIKNNDL